jgi:two-component system response regulator YesN
MFVDDEINIRDGLRFSFDWENMGYEVIAEAENGTQALDLFYETVPDVVITDICMNDGNGLEFIKHIKSVSPLTEIVVLSGYPNFEYAKTAMQYGVFSYLLKPVSSAELIDTLSAIKEKILYRNKQNSELFLYRLLQMNTPSKSDIEDLKKTYAVQLPQSSSYFIIAVQKKDNINDNEYYESLCENIYTDFVKLYTAFVCRPQHHHIAILIFCNSANTKSIICSNIAKISASTDTSPANSTIGVSKSFDSIIDIKEAYIQALYCISRKDDFNNGNIIYYTKDSSISYGEALLANISLTNEEISKIIQGISTRNRSLVNNAFSSFYKRIDRQKNTDISIFKTLMSELAVQITYTAAPDMKTRQLIFGKYLSPIDDISQLHQIDDIKGYISGLINSIFSNASVILGENYSKMVRDAVIYIMTNYPFNISVDTIANSVNTSRHHLMRVFKKETGSTITDFVTQYRINIAMELLKNGRQNVSQVAEQVGYSDVNYFSKVFKKMIGQTPKTILQKKDV